MNGTTNSSRTSEIAFGTVITRLVSTCWASVNYPPLFRVHTIRLGLARPWTRKAATIKVLGVPLRQLAGPVTREETVSKSRFVTRLLPVTDQSRLKALTQAVRKAEHGARHHATACVMGADGQFQRSSDDGEPAGTAGAPMLAELVRAQVTDVLAVSSRHFGGVLLGKPGLKRAYGGGVARALDGARLAARRELAVWAVAAPLGDAGRLEHALRRFARQRQGALGSGDWGLQAVFELAVDPAEEAALEAMLATLALPARARRLGTRIVTIEE
jgi:uncharacterized YigZ family protein